MLRLRYDTPPAWQEAVLANLERFLQDHAANERKVSQAALSMVTHYPDRRELVAAMISIAQEELDHFRQVYELLVMRQRALGPDGPDPYMGQLRYAIKTADSNDYLLNRLVLFGIVEARGCERFGLVADALEPGELKDFYTELVRSEARHHGQCIRLARLYFPADAVEERIDQLLDLEAEVAGGLEIRGTLH